MPFKEKIAWISVVTTVIVWGAYFAFAFRTMVTRGVPHPVVYMGAFTAAVVIQAVLASIAAIVVAILAPKDAGAAADERDREVARRSYAIAYPVLISLIVCVTVTVYFGATPWDLVNGMMAAIVIAEIVHYGAQIVGYRRGA